MPRKRVVGEHLMPVQPAGPDRPFEVGKTYLVTRGGLERPATILNSRRSKTGTREAYISFVGEDKRLDTWVPSAALGDEVPAPAGPSRLAGALAGGDGGSSVNGGAASPRPGSERSTPEREHEIVTRVRNFEDVRFGEYLIRTWYYSPYPLSQDGPGASGSGGAGTGAGWTPEAPRRGRKRKEPLGESAEEKPRVGAVRPASDVLKVGVGKGGEGAMGRLWVCDLCFKYMRTRAAWDMHTTSCTMMQPPGRKVYQRGSYSIWEVDGAESQLYCQNLCLFGKLFIDHKSVYFHTENFLFYVLCDAATSRRDQVMTFFSKEKFSYDDYNLACIITFPPFQNRGFGKLLIEFSYYLTKHPSTRSPSGSPGTPERPLSDLGFKGYMAYWAAVVLRFCRQLLADIGPPPPPPPSSTELKKPVASEGRTLRVRKSMPVAVPKEVVVVNGVEFTKEAEPGQEGHYAVRLTLESLAHACHLRMDDVAMVLAELGFLRQRRALARPRRATAVAHDEEDGPDVHVSEEPTEWTDVEIVVTREAVNEQWAKWGVKELGVLDEKYVLL